MTSLPLDRLKHRLSHLNFDVKSLKVVVGRPLAANSKLSLGNPLKVSSRDWKSSLDHRKSDQSSAGSIKMSFKLPDFDVKRLKVVVGWPLAAISKLSLGNPLKVSSRVWK